MIGNQIAHYIIQEKLGEGGMGIVYKAEDTKLKRNVALKFLSPHLTRDQEANERFIQEAQAASALDHQNICTIHEINETDDGQLYIVMTYYEGETLKQKIKKGALEIDEAINIAVQIAEGLKKAHQKGIVHRDIKPANVMITPDDVVKILDFGLAKLAGTTRITKSGSTMGTVVYMSPEQTKGDVVDHRTDIWSMGVVLYEMLTGELPFIGEYDQAIVYSIINEDPKPITCLPEDNLIKFELIINKCLRKQSSERYQTIGDISNDLYKAFGFSTTKKSTIVKVTKSKVSRHVLIRWLLAVGGLVIIIIMIGALILLQRQDKNDHILERKMLVVLPFENLGPEEESYFASGITDAITARLAGIHGLGIISRQSAIQYKESDKNTQQIGEELGVDYILEGTVQRERRSDSTSQVRVIPQLIRVADDLHLWAETYDKDMIEIFKVQSEIAERVAQALDITLLKPDRKALEEKSSENLEAYEYYLRGNDYLNKEWVEKDLLIAIQMYNHALDLDSSFALAYAKLAKAHIMAYQGYHDRSQSRLDLAKTTIDKALKLDKNLIEAHLSLGRYYYCLSDFDQAMKEYEIVLRKQPSNSDVIAHIAFLQRRKGKLNEAIQNLSRAVELNPRDHTKIYELALTQLVNHDFRKAEQSFNRVIKLIPDWFVPYLFKSVLYMSWKSSITEAQEVMRDAADIIGYNKLVTELIVVGSADVFRYLDENFLKILEKLSLEKVNGDSASYYLAKIELYARRNQPEIQQAYYDSARIVLEHLVRQQPDEPYYHAELGNCYAGLGLKEDAIRECQKAIALLPVSEDVWAGSDYLWYLAETYVILGEYDAAIKQLKLALTYPGIMSKAWLKVEKLWDPLRDNPDFQKLLEESE